MNDTILGWHFVREDRKLRDGQIVKSGRVYRLPKGQTPELCERGYHASERAIDALKYAPGPVVCRVELRGTIIPDTDKAVATERKVLWVADATTVLHELACWCAERALRAERKAGREPDPRSWEAVKVKRRWLAGKATNQELSAAWSAADSAAASWSAARSAAWSAADFAAGAASWSGWSAARSTVRSASRSAAARSAVRSAADRKLTSMLEALHG